MPRVGFTRVRPDGGITTTATRGANDLLDDSPGNHGRRFLRWTAHRADRVVVQLDPPVSLLEFIGWVVAMVLAAVIGEVILSYLRKYLPQ